MTNIKKTTTSLDSETYYFLYQIAIQEAEKEKEVFFTSVTNIISFVIKKYASKEATANIENKDFLKLIDKRQKNLTIFISICENDYQFIMNIQKQMMKIYKKENENISVKTNQIFKSLIIDYYNQNL